MPSSNQPNERPIPAGKQSEKPSNPIKHALDIIRAEGIVRFIVLLIRKVYFRIKLSLAILRIKRSLPKGAKAIKLDDIQQNPTAKQHQASVDIIVYCHNSIGGFKQCIESVLEHTTQPYSVILVDDGGDINASRYLAELAKIHGFVLVHNQQSLGYALAISQAMEHCSEEYVLFLKSNAIVTPGWLDGMMACLCSSPKIGLVGPLSNQFITLATSNGGANINQADPVTDSLSPNQTGELITSYSSRIYPGMEQLDNMCVMARRMAINQSGGIGEDFILRAQAAGWQLALADNAFIYQSQLAGAQPTLSLNLAQPANNVQVSDASQSNVLEPDSFSRQDRILAGIYAHNRHVLERESLIQRGREVFNHQRLLFILPVKAAGGGSNSVFRAAQAMRKMGVEAQIMNLEENRHLFEQAYPDLDVPVFFGNVSDIPTLGADYDAVVATANYTVPWIAPLIGKRSDLALGYYIQDYEPYFYRPDSDGYRSAAASYTLIPGQARCVTTQWIYDQIQLHHGVSSHLVGGHIDTDLYRPRPGADSSSSSQTIRIAAMIRPSSERRSPRMTMEILQQASKMYGSKLEFLLFGCEFYDPGFAVLPMDFPWHMAGELRPTQIANLFNQSDIFVDYSVFQGLGMATLESMCCGLATIVPSLGGSATFAKHEENCLVVDTQDQNACFNALQRLIEDDGLRHKLQRNAISSGVQFYPELPAYNILQALFPPEA
jgi:glycosyltransferase involved in cell wall biosynthesis